MSESPTAARVVFVRGGSGDALTVAVLVLLTATTGARVVASDLLFYVNRLGLLRAVAGVGLHAAATTVATASAALGGGVVESVK